MKFGIYHPLEGQVNELYSTAISYEFITMIWAETLVRTRYRAQNKLNPDYASLGKRDTLTGDIISTPQGEIYILLDNGFKRLPKTNILHQKIKEIDLPIRKSISDEEMEQLLDNF